MRPVPNGVRRCCDRAVGVARGHRDCLDGFGLRNSNRSCSKATVTAVIVGKRRRVGRRRSSVGGVVDRCRWCRCADGYCLGRQVVAGGRAERGRCRKRRGPGLICRSDGEKVTTRQQ